ncbi:MAG: hypothetical protein IPP01_09705 [Saprospiraceae bacterium]|nr:hypothetical protein [Saprospiraceae bacterium]
MNIISAMETHIHQQSVDQNQEQSIETKLKSFTGCDSVITHEIKLYPAITPTMSEH